MSPGVVVNKGVPQRIGENEAGTSRRFDIDSINGRIRAR
jgi:hypothetical protein